MFGRLSWAVIPFDQPIIMITVATVGIALASILGLVTLKGWWPYLWREWLTSVDHKRIGVMYMVLAVVMLIRGFSDAIMMRTQQALAAGDVAGYLPPEHFDQVFSAHGTIMIFFMAMQFVVGLMNFVVPLQLGVRDVAFHVLNSVSFWLTATGVLLVNLSLFVGEFARTGWLAYPPLSETAYSPGVGVDYYLWWSLQISGLGTLLSGVNLTTTILKLRAPGMGYRRMPVFCWTALASNLLIVAAFPVLTATFGMLLLDRYCDFHFFTNDLGGNPMMYVSLIWIWGHPEVYILILPAFGVFSEVVATFSGKPLFGYRSMVLATMAICVLSFMVWLHHFFTMGAGADVNAFFGIMTMIIAVPCRGEDLQLALHAIRRPGALHRTHLLDTRLHGHLCDRRHDRGADGDSAGGLRPAQQSVPDCSLSQCRDRRRRIRGHGRVQLLVSQGLRIQAQRAARQGGVPGCWFIGFYLALSCPAVRLGLDGGDPPNATLPGRALAAPDARGPLRRGAHSHRHRADGRAIGGEHPGPCPERRDLTGDPWNGRTWRWSVPSPPPAWNFTRLPAGESHRRLLGD